MTAADEVPDPEGFRLAGISRVSAPGIGGWTGGSDEVPVVCWVVEKFILAVDVCRNCSKRMGYRASATALFI